MRERERERERERLDDSIDIRRASSSEVFFKKNIFIQKKKIRRLTDLVPTPIRILYYKKHTN